jgi:hypothetical protein
MLTIILLAIAAFAVLSLVFAIMAPLVAVIVLALSVGPLAAIGVASLFRHAAPPAGAPEGPRIPSDREASYDPVDDPRNRY